MTDPIPTRTLDTGGQIPLLGLGTAGLSDDEDTVARAVAGSLRDGYRLLDTAARYDNETGVGRGIAESGVPRAEVFVTTKLRGADHGYDEARRGLAGSLQRLGLDYVDLYLIHWPLPRLGRYVDSWRAMLAMVEEGLVRAVGVSNFTAEHVRRLQAETGVLPALNQVELSPKLVRRQLRAYLDGAGVVTEGWSPLGRGVLDEPAVGEIADRHGRSPAQIALRWAVQQGVVTIPKSTDPDRRRDNLAVFDFALDDDEMARLDALDQGEGAAVDADVHEET